MKEEEKEGKKGRGKLDEEEGKEEWRRRGM